MLLSHRAVFQVLGNEAGILRRLGGVFIKAAFAVTLLGLASIAQVQWRQASPGYQLNLPHDHASHPDYRLEWWYYTGNLHAQDGRRFGYQLTFFRIGVDFKPANPSIWAVRDLFMTHLAISDIDGQRYLFDEKFNRAGPGWAGAETGSYRVWNEGWQAELDNAGHHLLHAETERFGLNLILEPGKGPILHGEDGYSRKGSTPGNASIYYSLTRMPSRGTITLEGAKTSVEGFSWMDHEFGTSFLESDQIGWDWLSIQLDDDTELMVFELRRADGARDPHSSGTFVFSGGRSQILSSSEFAIRPTSTPRRTAGGTGYPLEWNVWVPALKLELVTRPALLDQEFRSRQTGISYWEGAIIVAGTRTGRPIQGRGYLEMTGYGGSFMGKLMH